RAEGLFDNDPGPALIRFLLGKTSGAELHDYMLINLGRRGEVIEAVAAELRFAVELVERRSQLFERLSVVVIPREIAEALEELRLFRVVRALFVALRQKLAGALAE